MPILALRYIFWFPCLNLNGLIISGHRVISFQSQKTYLKCREFEQKALTIKEHTP